MSLPEGTELTWNPTVASLTTVGTATTTGSYKNAGDSVVNFSIRIVPTALSYTTASTYLTTTLTLPTGYTVAASNAAAGTARDSLTGRLLGTVYVGGTNYIYPPSWNATSNPIILMGTFTRL